MISPRIEALRDRIKGTLPDMMGIELLEAEHGLLKARMPLEHRHMAPNGFLHAASVIALADSSA